jgi:hypothetical protein
MIIKVKEKGIPLARLDGLRRGLAPSINAPASNVVKTVATKRIM